MYLFRFRTRHAPFSAYALTAVTLLTATLLCVPQFITPSVGQYRIYQIFTN